jgi:cytochrome c oxidase cbb3-type subunit 3
VRIFGIRLLNAVISGGALCFLLLLSCQREKRDLRPSPTRLAIYENAASESSLRPGGPIVPQPVVTNPSNSSGYEISEGQRLFDWYNCSGCHAHGGGGIGPPLIKKDWIYGGEPANLFDTIVKGRPNGMPAWGARIPEYQIWQLVAYVRSMNGEQPTSATPTRPDTIEQNPQTIKNKVPGETK